MKKIIVYKDKWVNNSDYDYYLNLCKDVSIQNIKKDWEILGINSFSDLMEDLLTIALTIFIVDKKYKRIDSKDGWSRNFQILIPIINYDKLSDKTIKFKKIFDFLTGDVWDIQFYKDHTRLFGSYCSTVQPLKFQKVCLYSGGMDSYIYSLQMFGSNVDCLYVSYNEYRGLTDIQKSLFDSTKANYIGNSSKMTYFSIASKIRSMSNQNKFPLNDSDEEKSFRSRSILFITVALSFANSLGDDIPVIVPENGFIGSNLPLTPSRRGSLSTRTTHQRFLKMLNDILTSLNISNKVINPYFLLSKNEMVDKVKEIKGFDENISKTISCSHPMNVRFFKKSKPENCGYCYPCLIRRSSLGLNDQTKYTYDFNNIINDDSHNVKKSDLMALIKLIRLFKHNDQSNVIKQIKIQIYPFYEHADQIYDLYKRTIDDFDNIITNQKIRDLIDEV